MNDDEKFDAWLKNAAQDYQRAPNVPRAEMWEVIEAALKRDGPRELPSSAGVTPVRRIGRWRHPLPLGIAAALLLAAGIQIGRQWETTSTPAVVAEVTPVDTVPSTLAYGTATVSHLGRAEALLTEFRDRAVFDATMSRWARELLSDTRLLIDSPAASDPRRRELLEDLELVLVQLVQLNAAATTDDQDVVQRAIERRALLNRLRTAVPAGYSGT